MKSNLTVEDKKQIGVYILHNPYTDQLYVGSGYLDKRMKTHQRLLEANQHWNYKLQRAFNKDNRFEFVGTQILDGKDSPAAREFEQAIIDTFIGNKLFMNISPSAVSMSGYKHNSGSKELMSEKLKERWQEPDFRDRVILAQNEGRSNRSPEELDQFKQNLSVGLKKYYSTIPHSPTKGQTRSDEFRERNSSNVKDLWQDPEYRARQIAGRADRVYTTPCKTCSVDGVVYRTMSEAAQAHSITLQGAGYRFQSKNYKTWVLL